MSDKTDPRVDALQDVAYEEMTACFCGQCGSAERWVARLDAADRAAGVVRVDTNDEALVERLADRLFGLTIAGAYVSERDRRYLARAILAALREAA